MITRLTYLLLFYSVMTLRAQTWQTNGAAQYVDGQCIWLEATSSFRSGTIWSFDKVDFNQDLDLLFRINFGCANDLDGLAFVLQPTGAFAGNYTENLGVRGLSPSLIIELDVQRNLEDHDPDFDHIAVLLDGNLDHEAMGTLLAPVPISEISSSIDKCIDHWLRIEFIAKDKSMIASFDCEEKLRFTIPTEQITGLSPFHYGCSGGLGSSTAILEVCPNYIERDLDSTQISGHCPGDTVTLRASIPGTSYQWRPEEAIFDPRKSITKLKAPEEGVYSLLVRDLCGLQFEEVFILSSDAYRYQFSIDTTLCENEEITLDLRDQPFANQMQWNTGVTNSLFTIHEEGDYFLNGMEDVCIISDTVKIRLFTALENTLGMDRTICSGSELILGGSNLTAYEIEWFDGSKGHSMIATKPGQYGFTIDHRCGMHTEMINVLLEDCSEVFTPTAFSPNGDGINDFFKPFAASSEAKIRSLSIFDRWGAELFRLKSQPLTIWKGWDGKLKGVRLPPGSYLYMFELESSVDVERHKGVIQLLR